MKQRLFYLLAILFLFSSVNLSTEEPHRMLIEPANTEGAITRDAEAEHLDDMSSESTENAPGEQRDDQAEEPGSQKSVEIPAEAPKTTLTHIPEQAEKEISIEKHSTPEQESQKNKEANKTSSTATVNTDGSSEKKIEQPNPSDDPSREGNIVAQSARVLLDIMGKSAKTVGGAAKAIVSAPVKLITGDKNKKQTPETSKQDDTHDESIVYTKESIRDFKPDHRNEIYCAMIGNFNGHFKLYGEIIRNGIRAHFHSFNKSGGLDRQKIRLIAVEDNGNPTEAKKIISILKNKHKITLFLGCMGTRSVLKVLPLIKSGKITMLFPWAGSAKLRKPHLKHMVNGLGYLQPQINTLVDYCTQGLRHGKIAIFHSDGSFSSGVKNNLVKKMTNIGLAPVGIASYNRQTMDIKTPARALMKTDPKIVISLSSSYPTSKLISYFFERGHYGTKFIGIDSTLFVPDILRLKGASYSYTSTVPNPATSQIDIATEYRADMEQFFPHEILNILSFSSYIHARIVTTAIKNAPLPRTDAGIVAEIENMKDFDLGGFTVDFNSKTRHAYPHIITIITEG